MKIIETNNYNTKDFYVKKEGKCKHCKYETLLEENPENDTGNGLYELYSIAFCTNCGFWYNSVMEDFFTAEELEEQLK